MGKWYRGAISFYQGKNVFITTIPTRGGGVIEDIYEGEQDTNIYNSERRLIVVVRGLACTDR